MDDRYNDTEDLSEATEDAVEETQYINDPEKTKDEDEKFDFFDIVRMIISAVCIVVMVLSFIFRTSVVDGSSMEQTLHHGDRLLTSNLFYTPKTGDVIIFEHSDYSYCLVKRVIATEGQTVYIDESGNVFVDDVMLTEEYAYIDGIYRPGHTKIDLPYKVPEGHVFVMGDNRNNSEDSRWFGSIDEQQILGRVYLRLLGDFGPID